MYTPRATFSRLFLKICPFVLSLYTLDRLVTLSCEISDQSPITCVNSHYNNNNNNNNTFVERHSAVATEALAEQVS